MEEYKNQSNFRNWNSYIEHLPIDSQDKIIDFGCSIGVVTKLLANNALQVFGIDNNPVLLEEAKIISSSDNIDYINMDLSSANYEELPLVDGIWSSFVAAYFPDFTIILNKWINLLKPNGWMAITEMSDLFAHEPLSQSTRDIFRKYYDRQRKNNVYDFEMGSKLKNYLTSCGLSIVHEENKFDQELSFNGPAKPEVLKSWESRFDRMIKFKEYVGENKFQSIKSEFMDCLSDKNHRSNTIVKFILAKK